MIGQILSDFIIFDGIIYDFTTMKKRIFRAILPLLILLYTLLVPYTPTRPASAQAVAPKTLSTSSDPSPRAGTYACVLSNNAYFYLSSNGKDATFLLPKTYYVYLLSYDDTYCKVEYLETDTYSQKLTGYVRTDYLAFVDYVPLRPYLNYVFDLTYRLENTSPNKGDAFTELTFQCTYYGDYPIGDTMWCYVLREGEFGYVPKPEYFHFEENTEYADYLASIEQAPTQSQDVKQKSASSPAQIAILVTLCLLVPLLGALILKPPRKPPYETGD